MVKKYIEDKTEEDGGPLVKDLRGENIKLDYTETDESCRLIVILDDKILLRITGKNVIVNALDADAHINWLTGRGAKNPYGTSQKAASSKKV